MFSPTRQRLKDSAISKYGLLIVNGLEANLLYTFQPLSALLNHKTLFPSQPLSPLNPSPFLTPLNPSPFSTPLNPSPFSNPLPSQPLSSLNPSRSSIPLLQNCLNCLSWPGYGKFCCQQNGQPLFSSPLLSLPSRQRTTNYGEEHHGLGQEIVDKLNTCWYMLTMTVNGLNCRKDVNTLCMPIREGITQLTRWLQTQWKLLTWRQISIMELECGSLVEM